MHDQDNAPTEAQPPGGDVATETGQACGDFGWALAELKRGGFVKRVGWANVTYIHMQVPDSGSKMSRPYIYAADPSGLMVPWLASQVDMFADDWVNA